MTRLAPSPTGALHLGNARTFLVNWAIARQGGWRIILRIEDLDGPRVKPGADRQAIEDMLWLGIDWDEQVPHQRQDLGPYAAALAQLRRDGLIYPCRCTRREIAQAQSAPHAEDHELRYPGTCRPHAATIGARSAAAATTVTGVESDQAWRLIVPDEGISFSDRLQGPQTVNVQQQVGDFIVATKAGLPAYQLAVVVDDARQGVTDVIRGDDLLGSTGRQQWLYRLLDLTPLPLYWHLPLVIGTDGRRLAKRHGDSRLRAYREAGVSSERIIGLLAFWCGVVPCPTPLSAAGFRDRFHIDRMPRTPAVFDPTHDEWLRS